MGQLVGMEAPPAPWHVIITQPGRWRQVLDGLSERRLAAYVPMETVWRTGSHHRSSFDRPLIPGYVFARLEGCAHLVHEVYGAQRLFCVGGVPRLAPGGLVAAFQARQAAGEFDQTRGRGGRLVVGDRVLVCGGPWDGHLGKITRLNRGGRAKVLLEALGWPANAEVSQLQAVG